MNDQPMSADVPEAEKREPAFGEEYEASRPGIKTLICVLVVIGLIVTADYWTAMLHDII